MVVWEGFKYFQEKQDFAKTTAIVVIATIILVGESKGYFEDVPQKKELNAFFNKDI